MPRPNPCSNRTAMSIPIATEPVIRAAPTREQTAASVNAFFLPKTSAKYPCAIAPTANPKLNKALIAPRILL
jgi:hypothetical protein